MTNLWRSSEIAREFVFDKRLASLAAQLLGVEHVRLYHDQALYKESGGGITPWHADQFYWPLSTDKTITAWVPLQETPLERGGSARNIRERRANRTVPPRAVMTVIYMADGIRLIAPQRKEHVADREAFMPGINPGEPVAGALNPILI